MNYFMNIKFLKDNIFKLCLFSVVLMFLSIIVNYIANNNILFKMSIIYEILLVINLINYVIIKRRK